MEIINKFNPHSMQGSDMPIKPIFALDGLFDTLKPFSKSFKLMEGESLSIQAEQPILWLFTEGTLTIIREHDELHLQSARAKFIYGLVEAFQYRGYFLLKAETQSKGYCIPADDFIRIINEARLWENVAAILSYYINILTYRDQQLVGSDTYTVIRHKLIELMSYPPDFRMKTNNSAFRYIQQRTNISRSNIFRILSDLNKGGYINIKHGQLNDIHNIPLTY